MITENDVRNICRFYTTNTISFELMGVSHNTVYKILDEKPFILRVTSTEHRTKKELLGEMDFLFFLSSKGMDVNRPMPSLKNEMVTDCQIGGETYHITAFTFVEGRHWTDRTDDLERLEQIGKALGRLHSCARQYVPGAGVTRRRSYNDSQHIRKAPALLAGYDPGLCQCFHVFLKQLESLPQSRETFGLTHGDFLFSNYHITENSRVWIFDFDECEYNWYISDIAVCLYYYLIGGDPSKLEGKAQEAEHCLIALMTGYLQENHLPPEELMRIELFFRLRDYILLSTIIGYGQEKPGAWDQALVDGALPRVTAGKPFADIDMKSIVSRLYAQ